MGRRLSTNPSLPMMDIYSNDPGARVDSALLSTRSTDPQLEQILAEDRRKKAKKKRSIVCAIVACCLLVVLILASAAGGIYYFFREVPLEINATVTEPPETDDPLVITEELRRVNCYPEQDGSPFESWHVTKEECDRRHCVYRKPRTNRNMPICYVPIDGIGYRRVTVKQLDKPHRTFEHVLRRLSTAGIFGTMKDTVKMQVTELSESIIRIHAAPAAESNSKTRSTPFDLGDEGFLNDGPQFFIPDPEMEPKYKFEVIDENPFSYRVRRQSPNDHEDYTHKQSPILWDTDIGGLVFTGDFIQIAGLLPRDSRVYGIGEHRHEVFQRNHKLMAQTWSLFSRNQPPDWMPETHLYGAHPFVMVVDSHGRTHGILFYNAAPSEITVNPYPSLTWRSVAGVIDMFIFTGPTPDNVIQQYTQLIGRPMLPPQWLLGLQVCFSDIETLGDLERQVVAFDIKRIPWDSFCIKHSLTNQRYDTLENARIDDILYRWRISKYNNNDKKIMLGVLPHVSSLTRVIDSDVLLGRAVENAVKELSCVLPSDVVKQTYFLYKNHEFGGPQQTFAFWDPLARRISDVIGKFLSPKWRQSDFDAIDLLENQPFVNSRDKNVTTSTCLNYELPYTTRAGYFQFASSSTLSKGTVCALSLHRNCSIPHIDVHNAYGMMMSKSMTEAWLVLKSAARLAMNKRSSSTPLMSSSSFPGSGKFGGHWLGQTAGTWMSMQASIMSTLEFNWFGIPTVGDWICGGEGPGDLELCTLWSNLAAFLPVIRYDYDPKGRPEFFNHFNDTVYVSALARAMKFRRMLLPYIFTQLFEFSQNGIPAWKPLFHLSPGDPDLASEYQNFMLGDAFLIAPTLHPLRRDYIVRVQLVSHFRWTHILSNTEYDMCRGGDNQARIFRSALNPRFEKAENYVYIKGGSIAAVDSGILPYFNLTVPKDTGGRKVNFVDYGAKHISLLASGDCPHRKSKSRPIARGSFFWEGGINETSSIYVTFSLSQFYVLEGKVIFQPPRALHSHLPPNVPRPPSLPWPFEVIIDHVIFYGLDPKPLLGSMSESQVEMPPTRLLKTSNDVTNSTSSETTPKINYDQVKVDVKQAIAGDATQLTTRESTAYYDRESKILTAARIFIPLSEGDFSVVLVPSSGKHISRP